MSVRFGLSGVVLEVVDDGSGIPEEKDRVQGMGIRSMRYRARAIGGRLDISNGPAGGTRVCCSVGAP